jgi:hypothetical protein
MVNKKDSIKVLVNKSDPNHPRIMLTIPSLNFGSPNIVIVSFFDLDVKRKFPEFYHPRVHPIIGLGDFVEPEEARQWGRVMEMAAQIACGQMPEQLYRGYKDEITYAWATVSKHKEFVDKMGKKFNK